MAFQRTLISENILASGGDTFSTPLLIPDGSSKITAQLLFSGLAADASLSLQQSTDGKNFNPVLDSSGVAVTVVLDKDDSSSTLNIINLLTVWIRFAINFNAGQTGSISSVNYLTI